MLLLAESRKSNCIPSAMIPPVTAKWKMLFVIVAVGSLALLISHDSRGQTGQSVGGDTSELALNRGDQSSTQLVTNPGRKSTSEASDVQEVASGLDVVVSLPTLLKDGRRLCLREVTTGCATHEGPVVIPTTFEYETTNLGKTEAKNIKVPIEVEHIFKGDSRNIDGDNIDVRVKLTYDEQTVIDKSISSQTNGLYSGTIELGRTTWDAQGFPNVEMKGTINIEVSLNRYNFNKSIRLGVPNLGSANLDKGEVTNQTEEFWSTGDYVIVGLLEGGGNVSANVWEKIGTSKRWVGPEEYWENLQYNKSTLESISNVMANFNNGVIDINSAFIEPPGSDYDVQSTPIAFRIDPRPWPDIQVPSDGEYTVDESNKVTFDASKSVAFEDLEIESYSWALEGGNFSPGGFDLPDPIKTGTGRTFTVNFEEDLRPEDTDVAERPGSEFPYRLYLTVTDEIGQSKTKRITFGIKCGWNNISNAYDQNNDCFMSTDELRSSITGWVKEEINTEQLNKIITDWASGNRYWL